MLVGLCDCEGQTPLQPDIIGSIGKKIWAMTGLTQIQYVRLFDRRNLFTVEEIQSYKDGYLKASRILRSIDTRHGDAYIICIGDRVADAFGVDHLRSEFFVEKIYNIMVAHIPDPSISQNREETIEFLRSVSAVAAGESDCALIEEDRRKLPRRRLSM